MSYNNKKFLDANGVTQIVGLLDDYATNDTLSTVVNSVQSALDQKYSKPATGIPASDIADGVIPVADNTLSNSSENAVQNKVIKDALDEKAPVIFNNTIGNPVAFSDGADGLPIQSLKIHLLPRQEGTGDPSPQNIRPIVAWDGVKVFGGGKNIFPTENIIKAYVDSSGIVTSAIDNVLSDFIPYVYGSKITVYLNDNINGKLASFGVAFYDKDKNFITRNSQGDRTIPYTINGYSGNGFGYIRIWINRESGVSHTVEEFLSYGLYAQYGEDFTAYEPYQPITETDISFPSPVYGGTLDVVSGVLTDDRPYRKFKWSDCIEPTIRNDYEERRYYHGGFFSSVNGGNGKCNVAPFIWTTSFTTRFYVGSNYVLICLPVGTDENLEIEVCLKPVTPQEIQLTPEQITALKGDNTIWSDANGNIEIVYRADTELFLKQNTVKDVQMNGTSINQNGIANIPIMTGLTVGVARTDTGFGTGMASNGAIVLVASTDTNIKAGTDSYRPIVAANQHKSAFYALAKLAGANMAQSSNAVGTYTDAAKQGIQKLFGFEDILGTYESSTTASKAYTVGETFIFNGKRYRVTADIAQDYVINPGTNCELDPIDGRYVRDTDKAGYDSFGVVRILQYGGLQFDSSTGALKTSNAGSATIKAGTNSLYPLCPNRQHEAVFFGLAKAANADMASLSDVTVGQYPQAQKTAIQTMLGIEADIPLIEEVSGSTPSITGMPNVRYICGTCSLLTITPPASGSIVVRFTSGSTPTVLTVPNTVKFPVWFDYTSLEADTTYEIIITDGVYGGVMSWAD